MEPQRLRNTPPGNGLPLERLAGNRGRPRFGFSLATARAAETCRLPQSRSCNKELLHRKPPFLRAAVTTVKRGAWPGPRAESALRALRPVETAVVVFGGCGGAGDAFAADRDVKLLARLTTRSRR